MRYIGLGQQGIVAFPNIVSGNVKHLFGEEGSGRGLVVRGMDLKDLDATSNILILVTGIGKAMDRLELNIHGRITGS